jgi:hypothetical protein
VRRSCRLGAAGIRPTATGSDSSCPHLLRASTSKRRSTTKTWMAGTSPAMTADGSRFRSVGFRLDPRAAIRPATVPLSDPC